jgi:hypothetical protein
MKLLQFEVESPDSHGTRNPIRPASKFATMKYVDKTSVSRIPEAYD